MQRLVGSKSLQHDPAMPKLPLIVNMEIRAEPKNLFTCGFRCVVMPRM